MTVTPVVDGNQLILMIRIPLLDTDSTMTLYRVYNLSIYNPTTGKALSYRLEGSNLAVSKGNSYVTILTEAEFIECTLAQGHFCLTVLSTTLITPNGVLLQCFLNKIL